MKRIVSLLLVTLMLVASLAGCSTLKGDDKGAVVAMYLDSEIYNFDPTVGFYDDAKAEILHLIYDGLTTIDEKGKVSLLGAKEYKIIEREGTYYMDITLNSTCWSDGTAVRADDYIFAWKRLLDPDYSSEAASLLFGIKNAYAIKQGDASIDSFGATAVDTFVIEIEFEGDTEPDYDAFLRTLASPALVPLREDIAKGDNWAKKASTMTTNGPFLVKGIVYGKSFVLERNPYYYLNKEKNEALDKYVIPYRIEVNFAKTPAEQLEAYNNGEVFYLGNIALASRAEYKDDAQIKDLQSTYTYFFNLENPLFKDAKVRQALSLALDRGAIAEKVVFAKAAEGLVSYQVFEGTSKKEFREAEGATILASGANLDQARSLLSEAGVSGGSFTLSVRADEVDVAMAEMAAAAWKTLGFNVTVKPIAATAQRTDDITIMYDDNYIDTVRSGEYDVIGLDLNMLSTDAFTALSAFAKQFSGSGCDLDAEGYPLIPHITGYDSEAYNTLMQSIYDEKDAKKRAELLHEAEKKLLEDMPVIPVVHNQRGILVNKKVLSGIKYTYGGLIDLKRMKMKNYMDYKETEAEETAQ